MSRCTGHCCRDFSLNVTPGKLAEQRYAEGDYGREANKILAAFVYKRTCLATHTYEDGETIEWTYERYDCRYLLPNGDCGVYNDETKRPRLCADYPGHEGKCEHAQCTRTKEECDGCVQGQQGRESEGLRSGDPVGGASVEEVDAGERQA